MAIVYRIRGCGCIWGEYLAELSAVHRLVLALSPVQDVSMAQLVLDTPRRGRSGPPTDIQEKSDTWLSKFA